MIDIGSGRGYLSSQLSLMHGLHVLGVDSSSVNTHSAQTRSKRLQKQWNGLVRNAQAEKESGPTTKKGMKHKTKKRQQQWAGHLTMAEKRKEGLCQPLVLSTLGEPIDLAPVESSSLKTQSIETERDVHSAATAPADVACMDGSKGKYVPITLFVTQQTDLPGLLLEYFNPGSKLTQSTPSDQVSNIDRTLSSKKDAEHLNANTSPLPKPEQLPTMGTSDAVKMKPELLPSMGTSDVVKTKPGDIGDAVKTKPEQLPTVGTSVKMTHSDSGDAVKTTFMLTGLHTCGNLASNMLRLYVHNRHAMVLCNVGCCYHLLDEEFARHPFLKEGKALTRDVMTMIAHVLMSMNQKTICVQNHHCIYFTLAN